MENQVLSISQMRELIKLGVDTSKASMFWHPSFYRCNGILDYDTYEDIPTIKLQNNYNLDYDILAFTLQDILEMFPSIEEGCQVSIHKSFNHISYVCSYSNVSSVGGYIIHNESGLTSLDAAFNMLKWCLCNNYI